MSEEINNPTKKPVTLYTESNPNPNSLKFVADFLLIEDDARYDFPDSASAANSPLAKELFQFDFVRRVFITANFVTVTKAEDIVWDEITAILREFIKSYLESNQPIITSEAKPEVVENNDLSEIDQKISAILDEYVRPAVESDGGAIIFKSFDEGIVSLELQGSCSGCPASTITLKSGIENLLKRMVPEVKEVVAEGV